MTTRHTILGGAVGAVALALVLAVALSGGADRATERQELGAPTVTGDPLPPYDPAVPDPAVGMRLPEVTGETFDGDPVVVDARGPGVVLLVAHWCSHCQAEVPLLTDWFAAGAPDVAWSTVSTAASSQQPNWPPSAWLDREEYPRPVLADDADGSVASAYGATGFPFWVFVDSSGEVAGRASGRLSVEQLEAALAQLP